MAPSWSNVSDLGEQFVSGVQLESKFLTERFRRRVRALDPEVFESEFTPDIPEEKDDRSTVASTRRAETDARYYDRSRRPVSRPFVEDPKIQIHSHAMAAQSVWEVTVTNWGSSVPESSHQELIKPATYLSAFGTSTVGLDVARRKLRGGLDQFRVQYRLLFFALRTALRAIFER